MKSRLIGATLLAAATLVGQRAGAADGKSAAGSAVEVRQAAERLVADALRAELTGDSARRRVLLSEAIDAAPDYLPARWHSGQVLAGGEWLPVDKAQQAAAADPKRAEYQQLRASGGDTLDGQLALARWCRKNSLEEEARFHWTTVLAHEPNNDEALRATGLRWFDGRLMTNVEADAAKERARQSQQAAKEFAPQVARWERLLSAGDVRSRDQALGEIRALRETHVIPALEDVTLDRRLTSNAKFERCLEISLALVAALDKIPATEATASLLRHAVFSPLTSVRDAAIVALKKRPPHDYVPLLLASLSMPIESSFRVATDADGSVHYWHSLYREGPAANWSFEGRRSTVQMDLRGTQYAQIVDRNNEIRAVPARSVPAWQADLAAVAARSQSKFESAAISAEQQLAQVNRAIDAENRIVIPVLAATTNQEFGNDPRAWWNWWSDYNEYYSEGQTPEYEHRYAETDHRYYRQPGYAGRYNSDGSRAMSCFAAGTLVWTKTDARAIETLEIGDLVLAQNADTGELAYKPIIGRTVRPPSEMLKLSIGEDEIETTLGHPLWVAGIGWRMAKELADGAILHGVNGPVRVDAIAAADEAEAYNLIVADFNSYFVGKSGILVHDNTPREPTTAIVPGLVAK